RNHANDFNSLHRTLWRFRAFHSAASSALQFASTARIRTAHTSADSVYDWQGRDNRAYGPLTPITVVTVDAAAAARYSTRQRVLARAAQGRHTTSCNILPRLVLTSSRPSFWCTTCVVRKP